MPYNPESLLSISAAYFCSDTHELPVHHLHIMWRRVLITNDGIPFGEVIIPSVAEFCDN